MVPAIWDRDHTSALCILSLGLIFIVESENGVFVAEQALHTLDAKRHEIEAYIGSFERDLEQAGSDLSTIRLLHLAPMAMVARRPFTSQSLRDQDAPD